MINLKQSISIIFLSLSLVLSAQTIAIASPRYILNVPHETNIAGTSDTKLKTDTLEINKLSRFFHIDTSTLWQYYNSNTSTYTLQRIAYLAYISQKPFAYVAELEKTYNFFYIEKLLNITPNTIEYGYEQLETKYLASKLNQDETMILKLLQQKFALKDIGYSLLLAPYCDKSPEYILSKLNTASSMWNRNNASFENWLILTQSLNIPVSRLQESKQIMDTVVPENNFYQPDGTLNLSYLITLQLYLQQIDKLNVIVTKN